jgi:hypothetical protein
MYQAEIIDEQKDAAVAELVAKLLDEFVDCVQQQERTGPTPALEKRIAEVSEELKELR